MKVSDIMSDQVICISDGASLKDAHHLMQTRGVRHLPVILEIDGTLVGVLTHKKMIASVMTMLNKYGWARFERKERYTPIHNRDGPRLSASYRRRAFNCGGGIFYRKQTRLLTRRRCR